ncbi:hypothetical protein A3K72_00250 [Candidatus Woesearchaeota archaeon RBG_13_36_6]|nr:MAG: hypothetical protein A3K72_00250 [Candidatus Woesearchaeota archaeon RBG_13_36_6]
MYDIITVGSATVDVFVDTDSELIKIKSKKEEEELIAYPAGTKQLIKELTFLTGGGGTNTSVAFSRLGHKTGYIGKLGDDSNGSTILELLKKEGIDYLGIISKEDMTAYSIILDSIDHDRTIFTYKGAINSLRFNELNLKKLKTKWFYFSSMVDESFKVLEELSDFAKNNNIKIAFNPSSYLAEKGSKYLKNVLERTNILVLNKEEAKLIVGCGSEKDLLWKLHDLGPEIVVVTDGKNGCYCFDGKSFYYIATHKIKVVESTGAGDAFASGFLSGIIKKNDTKFALELGLANAESVISGRGAKTNLLTYNEAIEIMKKTPAKISKL